MLRAGLVDELRIAVHPVAGETGDPQLVRTTVRRSGVVDLTYVTA